jgi:hypothetical protein
VDRAIFTRVLSPRVVIVVVGRWRRLLGWIHRPRLEGAVDIVLDQSAVLERMLDGDFMVWARHVQDLLEVVLWKIGLGQVALGARALRSTAATRLSS